MTTHPGAAAMPQAERPTRTSAPIWFDDTGRKVLLAPRARPQLLREILEQGGRVDGTLFGVPDLERATGRFFEADHRYTGLYFGLGVVIGLGMGMVIRGLL